MTALNAAAATRDGSLNASLAALTGTILTAEESYGRAMLAAGRRHDQAVVSAAAARDAALLDAIDAALDTSGNGTGLAFTAAEAQPIREAVARLRGVVTASATVAASAVDATATFLGKLADRGTALSRALNAADNAFFSAVESAETAALDAAFLLRANYERAVIAADSGYASALATGSGEAFEDLATSIAERKTAAIESAVERDSNEFTTSAQHAPTWDANGRGSVFVDRYTLNVDNVLATLAAWDTAHPVVTNPPAIAEVPLDLGLPVTPPEWMAQFQDAFSSLPTLPPGESSGSAAPSTLPAWFAQLQGLVARGAQALNDAPSESGSSANGGDLPSDPAPLRTIEATQWTSLFHGESQEFLGARAGATDDVARVVNGHVYAIGYEAMNAQMSNPDVAQWLIADWDLWFTSRGEEVQLTSESVAALESRIAADFDPVRYPPNATANERLRLSLASHEGRIESLRTGAPETPTEIDRLHYSELVAYTRGSLKNPDDDDPDSTAIAEAFIDAYGFAGMWRLYQMEVIGHWDVAIADLTFVGDPLYPAFPGPAFDPPYLGVIRVNNRDLNGLGLPIPQASATEIAARVHSAIHQPGVTIGGSGVSSLQSTAGAAWSAFWGHPRTQGLMGMGFATLQMVGGVVLAKGSGGLLATIGGASFLRGADQFQASFRQAFLGEPKVRDITHQIVDSVASPETSDTIVSVGDFALGVADLAGSFRKGMQKAAQEASERLATTASHGTAAADDVASASREFAETVTGGGSRAVEPAGVLQERLRSPGRKYLSAPFSGSEQSRAVDLVREATLASGLEGRSLVDKILVRSGRSAFWVDETGRRILYVSKEVLNSPNRGLMLLEASHELAHAEQYAKALARSGDNWRVARHTFFQPKSSYLYAKHEVSAETIARRRIDGYYGRLTPENVSSNCLKIEKPLRLCLLGFSGQGRRSRSDVWAVSQRRDGPAMAGLRKTVAAAVQGRTAASRSPAGA